jgi:hypothetical protein
MQQARKESPPAPTASSALRPAAAAILLWTGAFSLSCHIPSDADAMQPSSAPDSASGKAVSTARTAISRYFYSHADTFFHRGVGEVKPKAFQKTFFQRMSGAITPEEHSHLSGQSISEIMPWLKFAMLADPHNTEIPMDAAFWMANSGERPDVALVILRDARISNPGNCELIVEEGRLFVRMNRFNDARRMLDLARRQWPGELPPSSDDALRLKREGLLYTALLAEEAGNTRQAIEDLSALLAIYPKMNSIRQRIQNLKDGTEIKDSARKVLTDLIVSSNSERGGCEREDQGHANHNHD